MSDYVTKIGYYYPLIHFDIKPTKETLEVIRERAIEFDKDIKIKDIYVAVTIIMTTRIDYE